MVGLGRMGANMTTRLIERGHQVVAYDRNDAAVAAATAAGADPAASLEALVGALERPRSVWVMVPSGDPTNETIQARSGILSAGDTIIDGGNSHYRDAQRWASGLLEDSGEGRWTAAESTERAVATPVITASLYARFSFRAPDSYSARIVAALRNEFGGHKIFETIGHDELPVGSATQAAGDAESVGTR